ncbi:MAG: endo alpha-1,4 polygalactosaminidase [Nocardioidaceae bacterium]
MSLSLLSRRRAWSVLGVFALLWGVVVAATAPPAGAATTTLTPASLTTTTGSTGGQGVAALRVQDQSGTTDTWAKYVELNGRYAGYAGFTVPGTIAPASVTGLQVAANYRGPAPATQTWTWSVWNWSTSTWTSVGTNAGAPDWGAWKLLSFTAPGTASSFVSATQGVRVQMASNNANDNADLDYLAVTLVTGGGTTDTTAPSAPTGVTVTGATASSVSLSWTASTDNVGVTGYEVFQGAGATPVVTTTGTTATVTGLAAATSYSFTVKARDAAGNRSAASGAVTGTTSSGGGGGGGITLPPANGTFDYQIGGPYVPASGVSVVDRDRTAAPAAGFYNVCYINAFQTQPGESGLWPSSVILKNANGTPVEDPGWPGEYVLDTRTAANRTAILGVLGPWMQDCKNRGYAAIEPDNLDSYTRSKGLVTQANNVAMAAMLVTDAHARGLAVAQKNDTDIAPVGRSQIGFDFAIVEECQPYAECSAFTGVYGTQVFEIEYTDGGGLANFNAACAARGSSISITYRDRDVVPRGTAGYVFSTC